MNELTRKWAQSKAAPGKRKRATMRTLDAMPVQEAASIEAQIERLMNQGIRNLGRSTALEILAALGLLLEDAKP